MQDKEAQNENTQYKEEIKAIDDNDVIRQILAGEKNLYALIIRKYNQRLFRIGLSIINNESEVEDVMQASYVKAYENLDKFKFKSRFSTWLTKILINESLLHLKKKNQIAKKEQSKLIEPDLRTVDNQTPLMKLLNTELKTILESSIRQLPEIYRTIFIMREMENMSVFETMECLNVTEANVKIRLNRAKVMLRKMLRGYLSDEEILQLYVSDCDKMVDNVMEKIKSMKIGNGD